MIDFALCANGNLTRDEVHELMVVRGDYVMETKYDGIRAQLTVDRGAISIRTRSGQHLDLPHIQTDMRSYSGIQKLILDGELVLPGKSFRQLQSAVGLTSNMISANVDFMAFDLMHLNATDHTKTNYQLRHTLLWDLLTTRNTSIKLVDQYSDSAIAMRYYDGCQEDNSVEGFVLKKKGSVYQPGRSLNWLRSKFKTAISAIPLDVNDDGTVMCAVWTGHESQQVHIATVQVPPDDLIMMLTQNLTMVVELEAYGVDPVTSKLRHPVYKGCRFDVDFQSCTADQLDTLRSF